MVVVVVVAGVQLEPSSFHHHDEALACLVSFRLLGLLNRSLSA